MYFDYIDDMLKRSVRQTTKGLALLQRYEFIYQMSIETFF